MAHVPYLHVFKAATEPSFIPLVLSATATVTGNLEVSSGTALSPAPLPPSTKAARVIIFSSLAMDNLKGDFDPRPDSLGLMIMYFDTFMLTLMLQQQCRQ
jgi:hypothetical protein